MERFLSRCAEYVYNKHTNNLHEVCLIFPNRRAGTFFNYYLGKLLPAPVIGPYITTVNEFITNFSGLHQEENLLLISELYTIFKKHTHTTETFDEFYFWGEILLSDFHDIDHYFIDAKDLFTNVSDIKEIDHLFDYLTEEQKKALTHFWGSIPEPEIKSHHEKFISIWKKLFDIYAEFKSYLKNKGSAYPGMIYREVASRFKKTEPLLDYRKYYIIGLNAMNVCEKIIFEAIGQYAVFLWDYDTFYIEDIKNEAGKFLRDNIRQFPPPDDFTLGDSGFKQEKAIKLVAVPSTYGQAQEIPRFLSSNRAAVKNEFDNCAIVLADESFMFPALGAIPPEFGSVNVTLGYPLKNSVVYGFLLLLINLLKNCHSNREGKQSAYHRYVTDILNHHLIANVAPEQNRLFLSNIKKYNKVRIILEEINFSPLHQLIFNLPTKTDEYSRYFLNILGEFYTFSKNTDPDDLFLPEILQQLYQSIEKLAKVISYVESEQGTELTAAIYFRLFTQYVGQASVAFEGEPLHGMQVMGILESRCLDFENLVIIGLNENKWPRSSVAPSFIPYNVRKGFGLPAAEEQDAMYAYYFFRLIQRAKNITITYSNIKEGISTGELSRYGYQLIYGSTLNLKKSTLGYRFLNEPAPPVTIPGSVAKISALLEQNTPDKPLSPTAINMWLQCSLRFYFRHILHLDEPDEMKDEIDSPVFGKIFHETIENLYKPLIGKTVNKTDLEKIYRNEKLIENEIYKAINKHYLRESGKVYLEGKTILIFENIKTFLKRLIEIDLELVPFKILMLENRIVTPVTVIVNDKAHQVYLGGIIDRVDQVADKLRIVDYKTGNVDSFGFSDMEELFKKNDKKPKKEILQALIYCYIYERQFNFQDGIYPSVYSLRNFFNENFDPGLKFNKVSLNYQDVKTEFSKKLEEVVTELLSFANEYIQTTDNKYCGYCVYNKICQRY